MAEWVAGCGAATVRLEAQRLEAQDAWMPQGARGIDILWDARGEMPRPTVDGIACSRSSTPVSLHADFDITGAYLG